MTTKIERAAIAVTAVFMGALTYPLGGWAFHRLREISGQEVLPSGHPVLAAITQVAAGTLVEFTIVVVFAMVNVFVLLLPQD